MANNPYNWNKNGFNQKTTGISGGMTSQITGGMTAGERKKQTKDRYNNPFGLSNTTSGIISNTQDIVQQTRETNDAIGKAARQLAKPTPIVKLPETLAITRSPRNTFNPVKPDSGGDLFHYTARAYDTRPTEEEKNEKEYQDNLNLTGGNEGYTFPSISPSTENRDEGEVAEKLIEHNANEGFTIRDDTRAIAAESKRRIEENAAFINRVLNGNEELERFANGIPAPGEAHQSIQGIYLDRKNKSDNAMQDEWGKAIQDWNHSSVGQGVMDVYHSGAAGMYDIGNGVVRGVQMVEPPLKKHYPFPWSGKQYADPETKMEYEFDPTEYGLYNFRQYFRDGSKRHENARSQDFNEASLTNPGYLGVKATGIGAQDIAALLGTAWIIKNMGPLGTVGELTLGALNEKGKSWDKHMDESQKKSEEEMWKNAAYRDMRNDGLTDSEARFAIGTKHARMASDTAALYGAVKAFLASGAGRLTRDGTEGLGTRTMQDFVPGEVMEYGESKFKNYAKDKKNNN